METITQIVVLVALALLAITVALFVFTSSLYKGAIRLAAKEAEGHLSRRREVIREKKKDLMKSLGEASEENLQQKMKEKLEELNKDIEPLDRVVRESRNKVNALRLRNMVTFPALIIVSSIAISGIADLNNGITQTILWIVSIAFLGAGVFYLYNNLRVIENISGMIDLTTLMEQALDSHEQKKKPILEFDMWNYLWNEELEVERGKVLELYYDVSLKQGSMGRNILCTFTATEELEFPKIKKQENISTSYGGMKNPKRFVIKHGDAHPNEYLDKVITIKAPDKPGKYRMTYWLQCDDFSKDEYPFDIKVI